MSGDHVQRRYNTAMEAGNNPLPPGTYEDNSAHDDDHRPPSSTHRKTAPYDPFIKNPEYERYQQRRSRTPDTRRSARHTRRRHSRSRSSSHERYHGRRKRDHKHTSSARRRRSPTTSRSRSPSRERKPSYERKVRPHHGQSKRRNRSKSRDSERQHVRSKEADESAHGDDEEDQEQPKENAFKNDGSFMAMFKKMQQEEEVKERETQTAAAAMCSGGGTFAAIGKRRGGRILKTGVVAKPKVEDEGASDDPQDAWSIYLKEVKRYKEACCDDDSKTRPLVK